MSIPARKKLKATETKTTVRRGAPYKHWQRPTSEVQPPRSSSQTAIPLLSPSQIGLDPSQDISGGHQSRSQSVAQSPARSTSTAAPRSSGPPSSLSLPDIGQFRPNHYPMYERAYIHTVGNPPSFDLRTSPSSRDSSPVPSYSFSAPNALQEDTPPKPAMRGSPGDRRRMIRWQERKMALQERRKAELLASERSARATAAARPAVQRSPQTASKTESSSSLPSNLSQGSVAGRAVIHTAQSLTQTSSDKETSELHRSQSGSAPDDKPQIEQNLPDHGTDNSSDEWLPADGDEGMDDRDGSTSDSEHDSNASRHYRDDLDDLLGDDPIEEEESVAMSDQEEEEDTIEEEEDKNSHDNPDEHDDEWNRRVEEEEEDHEQHLQLIADDLRPGEEHGSQKSGVSTYSEDLMREVEARERAENSLLDLGREGVTVDASAEEFKEYENKLLKLQNAQELIDDLERNPPIPVLQQENLAEAVLASRKRCEWLSTYFKLIKEKRAVAWLQMRGPLASNLINIWTWKLEFDIAVTIECIEDVNTEFGMDWCLLELLRKVERGEEGSPAARFTFDLYSTKYIRMIDRSTRPRPLHPGATLPRVSAWMTLTRFKHMDTLQHRDLYNSPPTQFFAAYMLDTMRYALKWHVSEDLSDWPMLLNGLNAAILTQLRNELANKVVPANPFNDEDLADPDAGGRKVTAEEVYEDILRYTKRRLKIHDKNIAAVHWEHKHRRSRRRIVGNIMPNTLLAPPPALDVDYLPDLETCREVKTTRVSALLSDPFWVYFGVEMCYRCRNRHKIPRQGVHRGCYGYEGAGCVECADNRQPCLRRKSDVKIKNISSKDWQPKRPRASRDDGEQITVLINNTWYNGAASEDTAPPEVWDELDDTLWLDMRAMERAERSRQMTADKAAEQASKAAEKERLATRRAELADQEPRPAHEEAQGGNGGRKRKRASNDEE
ncbi:hypothetical protein CALCODRAFT_510494 [Calocera cornea HHB12733]|uniref:Putative Zn2Cys6 domain-containing protein n=1 Tax=Calocera cornea HHB12733 TaxID=1353952 RepID=A0A165EGM7_9BASI|nr:hypothetical protein CALCODRAFT_510494 [Calocera cornea HHB12733]